MAPSRILLGFISCLCFPLCGFADLTDDGIVIYSKGMWGNNQFEFKVSLRGTQARGDMQTQEPVTYIFDFATESAFKLLPSSKRCEEVSWSDLTLALGGLKGTGPALVKTGKNETIMGYPAEQYVMVKDNGSTSEFWLTQAIQLSPNVLRAINAYTSKFAPKDLHDLAEQGYFELKKVQRKADGSVWMMREVIKIESVNLRDEVFEIPADCERIKRRKVEMHKELITP